MNFMIRPLRQAVLASLFIALAAPAGVLRAATITRGPYLQQGTTSSLVLRWRTDVASDSFVRYGVALGALSGLTSDSAGSTEHIVPITGLQADTKYYYEIGTSTAWFPGNTNQFFVTA